MDLAIGSSSLPAQNPTSGGADRARGVLRHGHELTRGVSAIGMEGEEWLTVALYGEVFGRGGGASSPTMTVAEEGSQGLGESGRACMVRWKARVSRQSLGGSSRRWGATAEWSRFFGAIGGCEVPASGLGALS